MWPVLITLATIVVIIVILYARPQFSKISPQGFSFPKIPWKLIIALVVAGLLYYSFFGREGVVVTHYLAPGIDGSICNLEDRVGDTESFSIRWWQSKVITVREEHHRCYISERELKITRLNRGHANRVSLR